MRTRSSFFLSATLVLAAAACSDDAPDAASTTTSSSASTSATGGVSSSSTTTTASGGGGSSGAVDRGPTQVAIDGKPNGLVWDASSKTLYIADDHNNRVLVWTDAGGYGAPIDLPAASDPKGAGLGGIVTTKDGTIYVARFGFGTAGDIVFVKSDGTSGTVPNLDITKRRIGLALASDGSLYESYFVKTTVQTGAVAKVDTESGGETDVISGLDKPVGVVAVGANLVFSDQGTNTIAQAPIADPTTITEVASIESPDLLSVGPNGSLFMGGDDTVRQIAPDGTFTVASTGYTYVEGTSYDAANKRLFVADAVDPGGSFSIVPIDP